MTIDHCRTKLIIQPDALNPVTCSARANEWKLAAQGSVDEERRDICLIIAEGYANLATRVLNDPWCSAASSHDHRPGQAGASDSRRFRQSCSRRLHFVGVRVRGTRAARVRLVGPQSPTP